MKATSNKIPERIVKGKGKAHFNYNIKQVSIEEPDGATREAYEYDYVVIKGKITKAKIIKALEDSKLNIEEDYEPSEIETEYNAATEVLKLSELSTLSYEQVDKYIDNNVKDLASTKTYLKKLSKVVLAMLKS